MAVGLGVSCLISAAASLGGVNEPAQGTTHALLINGGSKPRVNYLSHLHHVQEMVDVLQDRGIPRKRIHIFSADGTDPEADLARRDALPEEFWLLEGTRTGNRLRPRTELVDSPWGRQPVEAATRAALTSWFETSADRLSAGDRLLLFVTDHGNGNKEDPYNGRISLWQEELSVEELKGLLALLPEGVETVMVMSQCYSGTFAGAIWKGASAEPSGETCGFFSTTHDRKAYGCYPEGRDRDRMGHAFHFIEALDRRQTSNEAHLEALVTDESPDVPLRTSDVYLETLVELEADRLGTTTEALADQLLARAWRNRAAWEPEIRLLDSLGNTYGMFSPRSLAELDAYAAELPSLVEQMKTYAQRWKLAAVSVKAEGLQGFLAENPEWRERVSDEAVKALDAEGREALLLELLPEVGWYFRQSPRLWGRLESLRERAEQAARARWRLEVRQGALIRMRTLLVSIAGRVLLEGGEESSSTAARREALARLESCEDLAPGRLPESRMASRAPLVEAYPALNEELELLAEVLPSWLGVRYGATPPTVRAERGLAAGATLLRAVFPDSPATEAGLEPGDIVLGPPLQHFEASGQLREWTMVSPRETPLPLEVLRPGATPEEDKWIEATLFLRPYPMEWPELPGPPQVGEVAPSLPKSLQSVTGARVPNLSSRKHLLFFWATWCQPCKQAVPELLAYAADEAIPILAISDEEEATIEDYMRGRNQRFIEEVATDLLRRSFISFGVSGTPTILLIDEEGVVRHRQVGYTKKQGLTIEGWSWAGS